MYKHASASLQRKHRVTEIRLPTSAYIAEDDLVQTADNMGMRECETERAQVMLAKVQAENELAAAKRVGDVGAIASIGLKIQGYCSRLSLLTRRIKKLQGEMRGHLFQDAAKEVLSPENFRAVVERMKQLEAEMRAADG